MTSPGFNAGAVRFRVAPQPSQGQQSPSRTSRPSRPQRVRSGPPATQDLLKPILFLLIANVLILAGAFGVLSIVLSPFGIMAIVQGVRFGVNGVKMALHR